MKQGIYIFIYIVTVLSLVTVEHSFAQTLSDTSLQGRPKQQKTCIQVQQKIDSRLFQAVRESRGEQMDAGVLRLAKVIADNKGNLMVDIQADVNDVLLRKIEALGGKIIYPSKRYHTIRAQVNLSMVETIAGYPDVKFIEPAATAVTNG